MFNIEEGSEKHKEEVFQRRMKILQRAYRDGFFKETGTTPMPEIMADGARPDEAVSPYIGLARWAKQVEEEERRFRENPMCRSGYPDVGSFRGKSPLASICPNCGTQMQEGDADSREDWCPQCKQYWDKA